MDALLAHLDAWLAEIQGPDGHWRLFLMVFPYFLLLEVPLNLLVLLGTLRWFVRQHSALPRHDARYPRVSCIITCYSEGKDVELTLRSLAEQTYPGLIEIIPIVDGASANRETTEVVRRFKASQRLPGNRVLRPLSLIHI